MSKKLEEVIKKLSNVLKKTFDDYRGLYVFGVHADGEDHKDEDIEIVGIFGTVDKSKLEDIWPIIGKVEAETDTFIELYPHTTKSLKEDDVIGDEVLEEGIFYNALGIRQDTGLEG